MWYREQRESSEMCKKIRSSSSAIEQKILKMRVSIYELLRSLRMLENTSARSRHCSPSPAPQSRLQLEQLLLLAATSFDNLLLIRSFVGLGGRTWLTNRDWHSLSPNAVDIACKTAGGDVVL